MANEGASTKSLFGLRVTQSMPGGRGRVPLVSMWTVKPAAWRASTSAASTWSAGSPPVRHTRRTGEGGVIPRPEAGRISDEKEILSHSPGMTEEALGMTEEAPGMTEGAPGMTEEALGMTQEASAMTAQGSAAGDGRSESAMTAEGADGAAEAEATAERRAGRVKGVEGWRWSVSQKGQRRLQPEKRTNTIGVPVQKPSPCSERKISFTKYFFSIDSLPTATSPSGSRQAANRNGSVDLVGGHIHLGLPDLDAVGIIDVVADPAGDVLGRGVERKDIV